MAMWWFHTALMSFARRTTWTKPCRRWSRRQSSTWNTPLTYFCSNLANDSSLTMSKSRILSRKNRLSKQSKKSQKSLKKKIFRRNNLKIQKITKKKKSQKKITSQKEKINLVCLALAVTDCIPCLSALFIRSGMKIRILQTKFCAVTAFKLSNLRTRSPISGAKACVITRYARRVTKWIGRIRAKWELKIDRCAPMVTPSFWSKA